MDETLPTEQLPLSHAAKLAARRGVDGVSLTGLQKELFHNATIIFRYKSKREAMSTNLAELVITGDRKYKSETVAAANSLLERWQPDSWMNFWDSNVGELKTNAGTFTYTISAPTAAKDLATILARNGIGLEGKDLLQKDGPGGVRTI